MNLKDREIVAVEALVRGRDRAGTAFTPGTLFAEASQAGGILALDRQCREAAYVPWMRYDHSPNDTDATVF